MTDTPCYGLNAKRSIASREFVFQEGKLKKEEEISSSSYEIEPRNNAKRRSRGPSHNYGLNRHREPPSSLVNSSCTSNTCLHWALCIQPVTVMVGVHQIREYFIAVLKPEGTDLIHQARNNIVGAESRELTRARAHANICKAELSGNIPAIS